MTRDGVVAVARGWMGTPWAHQAMTKHVGADCLGFVAGVALECGFFDASPALREPRFRGYGRDPDPTLLDDVCDLYADRVGLRDATLADILRILMPLAVYPQHFGIVSRVDEVGRPTHMIHSTSAEPRKVTEQGIDRDMWVRVRKVHRFRGLE